jgi:hypothetical protein
MISYDLIFSEVRRATIKLTRAIVELGYIVRVTRRMRIMSHKYFETILQEDIERLEKIIPSSELTADLSRDIIGVARRPISSHGILVG